MKKFLPILRNSPFFKGLTDDEILSILHCVEATTGSKERDPSKGAALGAHIFFDDQDIHTEPASAVVPADTVPYRDGDNPKE